MIIRYLSGRKMCSKNTSRLFFIALSLWCVKTSAQSKYRPKIAEFSHRTLYDYRAKHDSETFGNANTEVEEDEQIRLRLGIPLVLKKGRLVGLQLKYDVHDFSMDFDRSSSELFRHIESRTFRNLGARLLWQRSITEKKSISLLAGGEIKSDEFRWNTQTMRYYVSGSYKVRLNERTEIGGGLLLDHSLGVFQGYPLFTYEHQINKRFTIDLALPKSAALRFRGSDKFFITARAQVRGWRYAIHNSELSEVSPLNLRKADLNLGLSFERELHDWLWLGLDVGVSKNLRYYLAEPGDRRRDAIVELSANEAPYVQFGIFIVPPRKFFE